MAVAGPPGGLGDVGRAPVVLAVEGWAVDCVGSVLAPDFCDWEFTKGGGWYTIVGDWGGVNGGKGSGVVLCMKAVLE